MSLEVSNSHLCTFLSERVEDLQQVFQASGAVAPDDGDCELMVEAKEHLRRFMETLEGIAFLLCEFTKMVRFLTTEAAMYRRGFDWSQCMDNQVMHHLDRCTKRWVQGP
jgi:hypothetical protein